MAALSLSTAWVETRQLLERDGRLFGSVALALVILPTVVLGVVDPRPNAQSEAPVWFSVLTLAVMLVTLAGQIAMIRLALGPSVTVGAAIHHATARLPRYILALFLLLVAAIAATIPFALVGAGLGMRIEPGTQPSLTGSVLLLVLVFLLFLLMLASRMMMAMPVASAEAAGPLTILKRSWHLTDGVWLKLFGFLLVVLFGAMLVLLSVAVVVGSLTALFLGTREPMSVGALIEAVISGLMTGAFSILFTLMLARIYVQLSGRSTVEGED